MTSTLHKPAPQPSMKSSATRTLSAACAALALALSPASAQDGETIFQFDFPYISNFAHVKLERELGVGKEDIDADGTAGEPIRAHVFSEPDIPEYLGSESFTKPGPKIEIRQSLGSFLPLDGDPPLHGNYGFTRDGLRMDPIKIGGPTSTDMGAIDFFLIPAASFVSGEPFELTATTSFSATMSNNAQSTVRFVIRADGKYYVSEESTDGQSLEIPDAASANWLPYYHAEARAFRFQADKASPIRGSEIPAVDGIGLYREILHFDGTTVQRLDLDLNVREFRVAQ